MSAFLGQFITGKRAREVQNKFEGMDIEEDKLVATEKTYTCTEFMNMS